MGLIRAFTGSDLSQTDAREKCIYCDALDENTLVRRGSARSGANDKAGADGNIITDGSLIAVGAGQTLLIVKNGAITDLSAETGVFEFRASDDTEGAELRAYFVNIGEITNNRFGFGNVPFSDGELGVMLNMQGYGTYGFTITDPLKFFVNVVGNAADEYLNSTLSPLLKSELKAAMQPVTEELARQGVRYDKITEQNEKLLSLLKQQLHAKWTEARGIELSTLDIISMVPDDESLERIRGSQQPQAFAAAPQQSVSGSWTCSCGMTISDEFGFCPKCGNKKPELPKCASCGFEFSGQLLDMAFCPKCGAKRA